MNERRGIIEIGLLLIAFLFSENALGDQSDPTIESHLGETLLRLRLIESGLNLVQAGAGL